MNRMNNMVFLLPVIALFFLQGCNVYQKTSVGVEEAVRSQRRVKVVTTDNVFYEFKRLQRQDGQLMGVTSPGSDTANKLSGYPMEKEGQNVKFPLDENRLESIYLKDRTKSNLISYGIPAVVLVGTAVLIGSSVPGGW